MLLVTTSLAGMVVLGLVVKLARRRLPSPPNQALIDWEQGDEEARSELIARQKEACPGAPFILPAEGLIGLLYGDPRGPYSRSRLHQGIDIFSNNGPGETPVFAAFDGFVTRETNWVSSLIIRVPEDPLRDKRQIWLYYTHMADQKGNDFIEDLFPPGTRERFVEQGSLLGYTGNYSGDPTRALWIHLHFSVVLDDGRGSYRNELEFKNTVDPSPYFGLMVNYQCKELNSGCAADFACKEQ